MAQCILKTVWPSLRRWLKAPFRKGVGSNPTAVSCAKVTGSSPINTAHQDFTAGDREEDRVMTEGGGRLAMTRGCPQAMPTVQRILA